MLLRDKKYKVIVQGCRTNQYEGEAIASALEKEGAALCEEAPDIIVIVTCTITAEADRKCRKIIRRAKRENVNAAVAVCGCCVQNMAEAERLELGIDVAVGNRLKYKIPELLSVWFEKREAAAELDAGVLAGGAWDMLELDRPRLHTRAFLKIQDGCNHYCSYCIVPYVRGKPVCRGSGEVLDEASRIAAAGCPEVVLTGIHIGLYPELGGLVKRMDAVPGIKRIRFGSVEPFAVDDKLLDALASSASFCPHLHLPLQSGDDGVLEKMRRGYSSAGFAKVVEKARKRLGDDLHISTDLMIGFPGEDEQAFEDSLRFAEEMGFGKIHVFTYSPRQGTDAARLPLLQRSETGERTKRALALAAKLHKKYASSWIGREVTILAEEEKNGAIKGLTPHFVRVLARCAGTGKGEEAAVIPGKYVKETLTCGDLCDSMLHMENYSEFL